MPYVKDQGFSRLGQAAQATPVAARREWRGGSRPQMPGPNRRTLLRRHAGRTPLRQHPAVAGEVAGVAVRILLQVVLVLGLRLPERTDRLDTGGAPCPATDPTR